MAKLQRHERFKDARVSYNKNGKQSMSEVAKATGIKKSLIGDLEDENKDRRVGFQDIAVLANHYGVTSDFLLGLTDDPHISKSAVDDLGLTPGAIQWINSQKQPEYTNGNSLTVLSYLLESNCFNGLFEQIVCFYFAIKAQNMYNALLEKAFSSDKGKDKTVETSQSFRNALLQTIPNIQEDGEIKEYLQAIVEYWNNTDSMLFLKMVQNDMNGVSDLPKFRASERFKALLDEIEEDSKSINIDNIGIAWGDVNGTD